MNFDYENMDFSGTFTGKSIDEAKQKAAAEFNVDEEKIEFKVINDVKKGLFGKIKEEAKVWAGYNKPVSETSPVEAETEIKAEVNTVDDKQAEHCCSYLKKILDKMEIEADLNLKREDKHFYIDIDSKGSGAVIGRRGETLDALQYLVSLSVNKFEGEYKRVTLDSCGYRSKREETLNALAEKISNKVLKSSRSVTLEPMNPYERRIIHYAVSNIDGVSSKSIGEEPYRKVVISSDTPRKSDSRKNSNYKKRKSDGLHSLDFNKTSFEKDYKKPKPEDDLNAGLYGKIEL